MSKFKDMNESVRQFLAWIGMISRCHDHTHVAYKDYGRRGIRVCREWHDFTKFKEQVDKEIGKYPGLGYSLDRINNDRGYEPGNIRWATHREQIENQRERAPYKKPSLAFSERPKPDPRYLECRLALEADTVCKYAHIVFYTQRTTV